MKKRISVLCLAAAMILTAFSGCSSSDSQSSGSAGSGSESNNTPTETVELEFWGWWSSDARKPYIQEMVDNFNESQDQYKVTYVDIPFGDIFTKNIAQIAAGNPCDIMANSMEEVRFRANEDQVEALDEYITDDIKSCFYDQYIDACTGDDGVLYAVPYSVDTRAIYYNKAHFEEANVDPASIQTWDDLIAAADKLDQKDGDSWTRVGFMPVLGNGGVDTWMINANKGVAWFNTETLEPTVNSDVNKDVLKWIRDRIDHYGQAEYDNLSAAFSSGMTDPFASGTISMLVHTSAYTSSLAQTAPDLEYGVIPLPEYKAGNGHTANGGGFVLEVPKGAKNAAASCEFIKYATSKDTQDFLATKIGDFSARNDFDDSSEFFQNPITQDLAKCLEETSTVIIPNEIKGYTDVINPLIEEGTLGITDTDTALDNAQKAFEDFVASK